MYGDVTIVVDEHDDMFYTRAALQAHRLEGGCVTVQPTPANGSPAALAHDVLYALGKRLAPGPRSPDIWLDSVNAAWLAAASWSIAAGVRHVVVPRAHLLTGRRIDQLLAWREWTGVQLTLLWQTAPHGLPPPLARMERRISSRVSFEAHLAAQAPLPARPFLPRAPTAMTTAAAVGPGQSPALLSRGARSGAARLGRQAGSCPSAMTTAQVREVVPEVEVRPEGTAALAALAHPLISGALSVLAFSQGGLGSLRLTRDIDFTGDVGAVKTHGIGHRGCCVYAVPGWGRPLLAAARAHHRLMGRPPTDPVFAPVMPAEARHLRAHAGRLPGLDLTAPASLLVP
ncbi:hypothetical protein [Streptomyces sp. SM10]|uniref:hypothetical protein n=1 Tax=Streptomyces sp. SM10 TaxID=565556 RepID=UPI000CD4C447|nr:hypothetical protein [Streptomyces sp. SM10]